MSILRLIAMIFAMNIAAFAQWVNVKLPNTPRTPDGKPILSAPAPKAVDGKPDLSGLWRAGDRQQASTGSRCGSGWGSDATLGGSRV